MRKVVAVEYVTLDGVFESPGEWSAPYWNDEIAAYQSERLMGSDALLLGRTTFEEFAGAWPDMDEGDFGHKMNTMPKWVAGRFTEPLPWNGTAIKGDVVASVKELKKESGGDLLIGGSATLVQTLLGLGVVDELRLLQFPIVHGSGRRLFTSGVQFGAKLIDSQVSTTGVAMLTYGPE